MVSNMRNLFLLVTCLLFVSNLVFAKRKGQTEQIYFPSLFQDFSFFMKGDTLGLLVNSDKVEIYNQTSLNSFFLLEAHSAKTYFLSHDLETAFLKIEKDKLGKYQIQSNDSLYFKPELSSFLSEEIACLDSNILLYQNGNIAGGKSVKIFDKKGHLKLHLAFEEKLKSIVSSDSFYYLASSVDTLKTETQNIFNLKGEKIGEALFNFESWIEHGKIANISRINEMDSTQRSFGIYNFEKAKFLIPAKYKQIEREQFANGILKCPTKKCAYYYKAKQEESSDFYDENFNSFYAKYAIEALKSYWESEEQTQFKIEKFAEQDNRVLKIFESMGIKIDYSISSSDGLSEQIYYGKLYSQIGHLKIIKVYKSLDSKPVYALQKEDSAYLLLPPIFDKIDFNIEFGGLKLSYKEETADIRLKRYTYD